MGEIPQDPTTDRAPHPARALAKLFEPFHSVGYYSREIHELNDHGYRGWWHAYFAYRAAPLGPVGAPVVTALFYNFAPRMVARAVPGVWDILAPAEVLTVRAKLVDRALRRSFGAEVASADMTAAAQLARRAVEGADVAARGLFAGHAGLEWPAPDDAHMVLWHACTLLREHRGDSHNIALAAAGVDGIEAHVLMAGRGHGNRPTIESIRGWTAGEWDAAVSRLVARGWAEPGGALTTGGLAGRSAIEAHTDELASEPIDRLGPAGTEELAGRLERLVGHLLSSGEVPGRWPPPTVLKPAG